MTEQDKSKIDELQNDLKSITPKGTLLNYLSYASDKDLDLFIQNVNKEQSLVLIMEGIKHAYSKGVFTIIESELLSKCLRKITMD